ncbi:MAG: fumarate/nitrate reduction transcriptional regulator Fnr [Gammaproteobacteria bacterium]|nr:fumarate/nitrate reduction transcriptional regulator Fnr [Gammaproteobacteria bacterium]
MKANIVDLAKIKVSCGNCNLSELCLPRGLDHDELAQLDRVIKRTTPLHKGDYLFRAGDSLGSIYAVRSGAVKLYSLSDTGEEHVLGFYLPGELVGLDAINAERHRGFAVALETSSYCSIPYSQLEEFCSQLPGLGHQFLRLMSREISHENRLLLTLATRSAEERIAAFLLNLSSRYRRLGYSALEFRLPMPRKDIGLFLGLTIETVSRIFSRLQREKIISADRRFVRISNPAALDRLCGGAAAPVASAGRA